MAKGRKKGDRNYSKKARNAIVRAILMMPGHYSAARTRNYVKGHIELFPEFKERLPCISSFQEQINISRPKINKDDPLDQPWSIGTTTLYPLNPEVVPKIFKLKAHGLKVLTIREALWMSRLCHLPLSDQILWIEARMYSQMQRVAEITGEYDSRDWDELLQKLLADPDHALKEGGRFDQPLPDKYLTIGAILYGVQIVEPLEAELKEEKQKM